LARRTPRIRAQQIIETLSKGERAIKENEIACWDNGSIEPTTRRLRVQIGNLWEEQFYLGRDPEAQIEYDGGLEATEQARVRICEAATVFGRPQSG
jgi:hypothetical protein